MSLRIKKSLFSNKFVQQCLRNVRNVTTQANSEEKSTHFGFETVKESEKQEKGSTIP